MAEIIDRSSDKPLSLKVVQRAIKSKAKSKQPRNSPKADPDIFYATVMRWHSVFLKDEPPYNVDSRERDLWLSTVWQKEPYLAGVLNGATLIDANRGWTLTGGRNQVNRFMRVMHGIENGQGWRMFARKQALAYRTSDLGAIAEIGTDGQDGPLATLWSVDPSCCRLTGNIDYPLSYRPRIGINAKEQPWAADTFLQVTSMPLPREDFFGLGLCGVSRAIELTKIMLGIVSLDQEKLLAKAPKGMLLLKGISQTQWQDAMLSRYESMSEKERAIYGNVDVFASVYDISAELISLSQLPDQFDRKTFTDILMYSYALCFGYSSDEFWPVGTSVIGRGNEAAIQHRKATSKGGMDFTSLFQEQLQDKLPPTVQFLFDERDVQGDLEEATLRKAQVEVINAMYLGQGQTPGWITADQARQLAVEDGLIPDEWTLPDEQITVDDEDTEEVRQLKVLRRNDYVMRAAYLFPDEPIIRYSYPGGKTTLLVDRGSRLHTNRHYSIPPVMRANKVLYEDDEGLTITDADVDLAIAQGAERVEDLALFLTAEPWEE